MPPTYDVPEVVAVISAVGATAEHPTIPPLLVLKCPAMPPAYAVPDTAELVITTVVLVFDLKIQPETKS